MDTQIKWERLVHFPHHSTIPFFFCFGGTLTFKEPFIVYLCLDSLGVFSGELELKRWVIRPMGS
jgi:hypothetical protein